MPQNSDGYYITAIDTQVSVDEKTGSHQIYAVVDTEDGEVVGASQRIMMYKQLTYDQSSSTAIADASRIIQSIVVNNTSGSFGFSRSVSLYDSKQNYFLNYRNGAYRLCDSDFEPLTEENGAYALKDGKLTLTLDPVTGRYRVSNADASFTIATGTTLSYGTDENGREIEKHSTISHSQTVRKPIISLPPIRPAPVQSISSIPAPATPIPPASLPPSPHRQRCFTDCPMRF